MDLGQPFQPDLAFAHSIETHGHDACLIEVSACPSAACRYRSVVLQGNAEL